MKLFKRILPFVLIFALLISTAHLETSAAEDVPVQKILLSSTQSGDSYTHTATLDGTPIPEYDYTWHADPTAAHQDVKDSPAEYYTGTAPTGQDCVYIAHDIIYYPELDQNKFQQVNYDGENEWVYMYEAEGFEQYIFSTLPVQKDGFPSQMMHTEAEAHENAVLHITQPGTYALEGQWHGQIWVDLGEDAYTDPAQKVTLLLNGVDITCTVAPGVVFYNVYECDNTWEEAEHYSQNVDTSSAGANVILGDNTVNNVSGTNIFRILKAKFKDESSTDAHPAQKKSWKIDGAFYSYQSMNISGTGTLNLTAGFEGLDTEHHLTLNGGNVNIYSQDDGINVNEDGVSVLTVNDGSLHICAGLGAEGDGIDSNGYLVVNGGTVITMANPAADSGLDSDFGSFVNGGTVVALGSAMDWAEPDEGSDSVQPVLNLRLGSSQSADEAIVITDSNGNVVFAYDPDKDETAKNNQRTYQGAILSAPGLSIGGSYQIYIGGDVEGTETSGIYDSTTVTGFSGAIQQCYSGTEAGSFGGRPNGMERPENMENMGNMGNMENMTPLEGMQPDKGQLFEASPEDFQPDQMQRPGDMSNWNSDAGVSCTYESSFLLSQQVNAFSGVSDYLHNLEKVDAQKSQYGINGTREHYTCTGCGKLFADENAVTELTSKDVTIPSKDYTLFIIALFFCGFAFLGAMTVGILLLVKKRAR